MKAMTEREFLDHCAEALPWLEEELSERLAQFRSETALFGDAGPGQGVVIRDLRGRIERMRRQYERLLAKKPRPC